MENFFYNITGIVVGVVVAFLAIANLKNKRIIDGIIIILHSILFIGAGIGGFFVPEKYAIITIFILLGLCITLVFTILISKTKDKKDISTKQDK